MRSCDVSDTRGRISYPATWCPSFRVRVVPVRFSREHQLRAHARGLCAVRSSSRASTSTSDAAGFRCPRRLGRRLHLALEIRCGIEKDREVIARERSSEFLGMSLVDLVAREMRQMGMRVVHSPAAHRPQMHPQRWRSHGPHPVKSCQALHLPQHQTYGHWRQPRERTKIWTTNRPPDLCASPNPRRSDAHSSAARR